MPKSFRSVFFTFAAPALLGLTILAAAPFAVQAQDESGTLARTHDDAMKVPSGKFVQDLGDRAIGAIADKNITVNQRSDKFRQILTDSFDLKTIGRFVIGRNWNTATPDQQKEYMHLFEELVIKSYGDKLTLYTGEGFRVTGARSESERDFYVMSEITHPDGSQPTTIDWRVRQRDGKLGVIDVIVEGVSLSVTQQQEYAAVIQRSGGQIDGLLDQMRQQLQTPSATASRQHG
jgi:phospholipid transport system substrate-binding protein